jgi:hypothetical protein
MQMSAGVRRSSEAPLPVRLAAVKRRSPVLQAAASGSFGGVNKDSTSPTEDPGPPNMGQYESTKKVSRATSMSAVRDPDLPRSTCRAPPLSDAVTGVPAVVAIRA